MQHSTPNRLSQFLDRPTGITVSVAADRADLAVQMVRDNVERSVDEAVMRVRAMCARLPPTPSDDELKALQLEASHIAGHAGIFGRVELGRAAYLLCELMDHDRLNGVYDPQTMQVFVQTMLLLRRPDEARPDDRAHMIEALGRLVDHARRARRCDTAGQRRPS